MATSFKILPKWEGGSWDGRLPEDLGDSYERVFQRELEPLPPRPTEEQAGALLDGEEFRSWERARLTRVAQTALGPRGEFSDVFDARRLAFLIWLQDNNRLQAMSISDEELEDYLMSIVSSQDELQ